MARRSEDIIDRGGDRLVHFGSHLRRCGQVGASTSHPNEGEDDGQSGSDSQRFSS
jgi:hypothetical protein